MVSYHDVMKEGYKLIKEETDSACGASVEAKAECATYLSGIVDAIYELEKLFKETEKEDEKGYRAT